MHKEAFVIPRTDLEEAGIIPEDIGSAVIYRPFKAQKDFEQFIELAKQKGHFRTRGGKNDVEKDPSVQQLIFYGFVVTGGKFLIYQRGTGSNEESRHAHKVSVGIGGHIEPSDLSLIDSFYREFTEEATIVINGEMLDLTEESAKEFIDITPTGLIKDERDDIGSVHLGVACRISAKQENHEIIMRTDNNESASCSYVEPSEYNEMIAGGKVQPEGWTQLIVDREIVPFTSRT